LCLERVRCNNCKCYFNLFSFTYFKVIPVVFLLGDVATNNSVEYNRQFYEYFFVEDSFIDYQFAGQAARARAELPQRFTVSSDSEYISKWFLKAVSTYRGNQRTLYGGQDTNVFYGRKCFLYYN
jgi:hypothetical protein